MQKEPDLWTCAAWIRFEPDIKGSRIPWSKKWLCLSRLSIILKGVYFFRRPDLFDLWKLKTANIATDLGIAKTIQSFWECRKLRVDSEWPWCDKSGGCVGNESSMRSLGVSKLLQLAQLPEDTDIDQFVQDNDVENTPVRALARLIKSTNYTIGSVMSYQSSRLE